MRQEREAMGLPALPTVATTAVGAASTAAAAVAVAGVGDEIEAGETGGVNLQETLTVGEEDKLMWLVWPFQVPILVVPSPQMLFETRKVFCTRIS